MILLGFLSYLALGVAQAASSSLPSILPTLDQVIRPEGEVLWSKVPSEIQNDWSLVATANWFDHELNGEQRLQFWAGYAKLKSENLWNLVGRVTWAGGAGGVIVFKPSVTEQELKARLAVQGYSDRLLAASSEGWGLRSGKSGAQLHFRESDGDQVSVHIDLNTPPDGWSIFEPIIHWWEDLQMRNETHRARAVISALRRQKI